MRVNDLPPSTRYLRTIIATLAAIVSLALTLTGCSRYAPVPSPVITSKILELSLTTAAPVDTANFYYYIVFDTSGDTTSAGPYPNLYGTERARNWDYYIRLHDNLFTEKIITTQTDADATPSLFDNNSTRCYSVSASGSNITLQIRLDEIPDVASQSIRLNFITSTQPVTPTDIPITATDYLYSPAFAFSPIVGIIADSSQYAAVSSHTVSDAAYNPADITSWTLRVTEK